MAARSVWKGFIHLSLVTIPVKAYTGTSSSSGEVRLNQLHAECNSRVKYQKVCPQHGELSADQIVSGYEFSKDQYVVVDPDDIEKLRPEDSKALNIHEFVSPDIIDPMYYNGSTHYLTPDGPVAQRPYALLVQAMLDEKKNAIAQIVWHGKDKLVLLRPVEGLIVMSGLAYEHEITRPATFTEEAPKIDLSPEEMKLTKMIVESVTSKKFEHAKYRDSYSDKLTQLIEMKLAGQEVVAPPVQEQRGVINLMDALKQSVAKAQGAKSEDEKPAKKMAPSKKEKTTPERKKKTS